MTALGHYGQNKGQICTASNSVKQKKERREDGRIACTLLVRLDILLHEGIEVQQ